MGVASRYSALSALRRNPVMPQPKPPRPPRPSRVPGLTRYGTPSSVLVPAPPPMQVVTKGWWVLRDELATVEELEAADRERQ